MGLGWQQILFAPINSKGQNDLKCGSQRGQASRKGLQQSKDNIEYVIPRFPSLHSHSQRMHAFWETEQETFWNDGIILAEVTFWI